MGADHTGETAEQLGNGEPEDQPVKGEEERKAIQIRPRG
jgi:hypothetical protein